MDLLDLVRRTDDIPALKNELGRRMEELKEEGRLRGTGEGGLVDVGTVVGAMSGFEMGSPEEKKRRGTESSSRGVRPRLDTGLSDGSGGSGGSLESRMEVDEQGQKKRKAPKQLRVLDIRRLADMPLHHVPASPWTDVTGDNDLVSHLVTVWWTWHLPFYCYMDRDMFISDMQRGELGGKFCSRFLVNAVLAMACVSAPSSRNGTVAGCRGTSRSDTWLVW